MSCRRGNFFFVDPRLENVAAKVAGLRILKLVRIAELVENIIEAV